MEGGRVSAGRDGFRELDASDDQGSDDPDARRHGPARRRARARDPHRRRTARRNELWWPLQSIAAIVGNDLRSARRGSDAMQRNVVDFVLSPDAGKRFQAATRENLRKKMAIVLGSAKGKVVISAPVINDVISDRGQIAGTVRRQVGGGSRVEAALRRDPDGGHDHRGAHRRSVARPGFDPRRRLRVAPRVRRRRGVHARLLQALGRERRHRAPDERRPRSRAPWRTSARR